MHEGIKGSYAMLQDKTNKDMVKACFGKGEVIHVGLLKFNV
jgi:hypothetical protein